MLGSIGVATFSRADLLHQCLSSIIRARNSRDIPLLVLHQIGDEKVANVINLWRPHIDCLIELNSKGKTPLQNINFNSILLRTIAFDHMDSDWFLGIEEDVIIGGDSINFIESMMDKYINNKAFRGVNLGSNIPRNNSQLNFYSRIRWGMQGQASAVTKHTWKKINLTLLKKNSAWNGLDGMMENHLKSGFMCTPLLSRYLDKGWHGTHGYGDPNHEYYRQFEKSFVDLSPSLRMDYLESKVHIPLRDDVLIYNSKHTVYQVLKNKFSYTYHTTLRRLVVKIRNQIRSFNSKYI